MSDDPSAGYFAQPRPPAPAYPPGYAPVLPAGPPGVGGWQEAPRRAVPVERPGTVVAAAVIAFVQAGLVLMGAAVLAVLAVGTRSALSDPRSNLSGLPVAFAVIAFVVAAFAGLIVLAGVHLLRGREWAAIVLGVVEGLLLLGALSGVAAQPGLGNVLGAGCSGAVIALLLQRASRAYVGVG